MISRRTLAPVSLAALLTLASQTFAAEPAQIAFSAETAYPESLTWSADQQSFFLGSVRHGGVGKLSLNGSYAPFITDPALISTIGLLVDDQTNTLWVTNSDPGAGDGTTAETVGTLAGIVAYDATTGAPRASYDLGAMKQSKRCRQHM